MVNVNLADAVLALCPTATFGPQGACLIRDTGDGPRVVAWSVVDAGGNPVPQPTPDQLAAVSPAQAQQARRQQVRALAQALLADPGPAGTALRAVYLAAGLTAEQVQAQLGPAAGG
ncbi:MAG TPA: hypothetical protein VFW33_18545 [Gemmataceae bacterium]|nr:hypothetical protein [Gemmataceae bacterium]